MLWTIFSRLENGSGPPRVSGRMPFQEISKFECSKMHIVLNQNSLSLSHFTDFTGYVVFIITSFLAYVESADQCLLNCKVLSWGHNE